MDIAAAIPVAILEATGNLYTGTPGDSSWLKMLNYFNLSQLVWANEPGGNWESLYSPGLPAGTVTATDTFSNPAGMRSISNKAHDHVVVKLLATGTAWVSGGNYSPGQQVLYLGVIYQSTTTIINDTVLPINDPLKWLPQPPTFHKFKLVPGPQLRYYLNLKGYVANIAGQLVFSRPFNSADQEYGGTIYVPCYQTITPFVISPVAITGTIKVDDPVWLIYYAAAEWAQTDVTLIQNVPSLISKATESMKGMKSDNKRTKTISQQTALEGAATGDTFGYIGEGTYSDFA